MAVKKSTQPPSWIAITSIDGKISGEYQVSDGMLKVRVGARHKSTRASSTGLPASLGAEADRSLAQFMLGEFVA
jgi:hypothetical protein